MVKKLISAILAVTLLLSVCVVSFGATGFSDLDETKYSWALEQISAMADKGIINGYPDGTYMPENKVTQNEILLLIARILGSNDAVYADHKEDIKALYEDDLYGMSLPYPYEISYLLYKGIFTLEEIEEIVYDIGIQEPVKRYEAAVYLTKVMNRYDEVKETYDSNTGYADETEIPANARRFVSYVKDEGLMLGMTETTFDPNYDVSRVQAAVLLYRTMEKQNIMFTYGDLYQMKSDRLTLAASNGKTTEYDLSAMTTFTLNGEEVDKEDLKMDQKIILMFQNNILFRVEMLYEAPKVDDIVKGEVTSLNTGAPSKITVIDQQDGTTKTFQTLSTCEVYVDDSYATLSVVRSRDYVALSMDENDTVFRIDILDVTSEFSDGIITSIKLEDDLKLQIERDNGELETYLTKSEVAIKRNGSEADFRDVVKGDKITRCVTNYGRITRLEVKSEIGSASGKVEEIVISSESSVVISGKRYPLNNNIKILVDGKEEDVYALRLDMSAKITTDSGTVTKIEVSKITSEIGQVSGTVENVNTSYGYINLKLADGSVKQISVDSKNTKITNNATGVTQYLRNVKVGDYLIIVGKSINGTFEAQTIVIAND